MSLQDFFDLHGVESFRVVDSTAERACAEIGEVFLESSPNRHDADHLTLTLVCSHCRVHIVFYTVMDTPDAIAYDIVTRDENDSVVNSIGGRRLSFRRNTFTPESSLLMHDVRNSLQIFITQTQPPVGFIPGPQGQRRSALISNTAMAPPAPEEAPGQGFRFSSVNNEWRMAVPGELRTWEPAWEHEQEANQRASNTLRAIHEQQQAELNAARQEEEFRSIFNEDPGPAEESVRTGSIPPLPRQENTVMFYNEDMYLGPPVGLETARPAQTDSGSTDGDPPLHAHAGIEVYTEWWSNREVEARAAPSDPAMWRDRAERAVAQVGITNQVSMEDTQGHGLTEGSAFTAEDIFQVDLGADEEDPPPPRRVLVPPRRRDRIIYSSGRVGRGYQIAPEDMQKLNKAMKEGPKKEEEPSPVNKVVVV